MSDSNSLTTRLYGIGHRYKWVWVCELIIRTHEILDLCILEWVWVSCEKNESIGSGRVRWNMSVRIRNRFEAQEDIFSKQQFADDFSINCKVFMRYLCSSKDAWRLHSSGVLRWTQKCSSLLVLCDTTVSHNVNCFCSKCIYVCILPESDSNTHTSHWLENTKRHGSC